MSNNDYNTRPPYRRIVISFLLATITVVLLILYYTLGRAYITLEISSENEVVESVLTAGNYNEADLRSTILISEQTKEETFRAKGTGVKEDKASGQVTIYNTNTSAQTLIASTRLLTTTNVLFRLNQQVVVPAGGQVTAQVTADKAGEIGEIGPSKFTIPGLPSYLQQKIYAENKESFTRKELAGNKVLASDLEDARNELKEKITQESLSSLREKLPTDQKKYSVVYQTNIIETSSTAKADEEVGEFKFTVRAKVTAVFYNPENLVKIVIEKSNTSDTSGKEILNLEEQSLAISIDSISDDNSTAQLKIKALGQSAWKDVSKIIDKNNLLGRTEAEVKNYFSAFPGVKNVDIKLTPFWVTTVPTIADHIELDIK